MHVHISVRGLSACMFFSLCLLLGCAEEKARLPWNSFTPRKTVVTPKKVLSHFPNFGKNFSPPIEWKKAVKLTSYHCVKKQYCTIQTPAIFLQTFREAGDTGSRNGLSTCPLWSFQAKFEGIDTVLRRRPWWADLASFLWASTQRNCTLRVVCQAIDTHRSDPKIDRRRIVDLSYWETAGLSSRWMDLALVTRGIHERCLSNIEKNILVNRLGRTVVR